jgi:AraC family transcriptional regulator
MYRVLAHIEANLDSPLALDDLAAVAHFSPFHFHRVFRGIVGESVAEHVRRLRLERAAARLRNTVDPIIDVALDAGYEAHESFTRAFYTAYGESPSAFRRANGPVRRPVPLKAPDVECTVQQLPSMRTAYLSHTGPYETVGATWQRLMMWAGWRGLLGPGIQILGISHDDPEVTPPEKRRYDAALAVPDHVLAEHDIQIGEIGGREYARATHLGPYSRFSETYIGLCGVAIPRLGREMANAPPLEFYRNYHRHLRPSSGRGGFMTTATLTKLDLYKEHAADYATPRKPVLLNIAPAKYLTIVGSGKPGGDDFKQKIGALYGMAFTVKMASKFAGQDYTVCKLEGQFWAGECGADFANTPKDEWRWKLMIRTPEFIGAKEMRAAIAAKSERDDLKDVKLETIREGKCVQVLHVGPYEKEPESIEKMRAAAEDAGYEFHGVHHEIYLSDPRRVTPEKLKTILRIPVDRRRRKDETT